MFSPEGLREFFIVWPFEAGPGYRENSSRGMSLLIEKILSENGIAFQVSKCAFGKTFLSGQALKAHPCFFHHTSRGDVFTPGECINPIDRGLLKQVGNDGT